MKDNSLPPAPSRFRVAAQVALGVLIVAALIWIILGLTGFLQERSVPDHMELIRPPHEVSALLIDGDVVWTGGKDGVHLFSRTDREPLPLPAGAPPLGYVRDLCRDSAGSVWIAHDGGLVRYAGGAWETFSERTGAPFRRARSVLEVDEGELMVGTDGMIALWDGSAWEEVALPSDLAIVSADVLYRDRKGAIWVGCGSPTHGGLYRFDDGEWSLYSRTDGLPHDSVNKIAEDRTGALWVATGFASHGGAALFNGDSVVAITQADGLAGGSTRSVYTDHDGRVWVGSEYDGIAVLDAGRWVVLTKADGLAGNEVKEMVQDEDGVYWLGTDGGLSVITDSTPLFS
ncbi:MAG: two-component regulator propeller domain-containing protein [Methanomicrobiaceae archaeon]|nr:two-component regulator propeller domain-containing protein [Methanomicrobiaceae archaeon]